jgi:hypothetical protein
LGAIRWPRIWQCVFNLDVDQRIARAQPQHLAREFTFNGVMSDVRLYERLLSSPEISQLANAGLR